MIETKTLEVYYHGEKVGTLAETPDRRIAFQYDAKWIRGGFPISPFSLPLDNRVFVPAENTRERFGGLFGVFADSLPDTWGQLLLDRHLDSMGLSRGSVSTLDRLAYVGRSGMGALEYYPSHESDFSINTAGLDFDQIAKECENILSSKESIQLDMLYQMGGSSGGTRPKVLLYDSGKDWIVKFPSKTDSSANGIMEYEYSLCAKTCGIHMTGTELIPSKVCDGYFKTERFDRVNGAKVFTITFAGLLEADFRAPACDYEAYFKLVNVLTRGNKKDREQLYRIMCFNVLTHNLDDHTKNFSFLYDEEKGWRLAPAYDLTYSKTYWGEHTTSVNRKGIYIEKEDLIKLGVDAGMSKKDCMSIFNELQEKTTVLEKYF